LIDGDMGDAMGALLQDKVAKPDYEADFYSWAMSQAKLLREGRLDDLDIANLAEEIETSGRSERNALRSHYKTLALHLLRYAHQPSMKSRSWLVSIVNARAEIRRVIEDNPGLRPMRDELFAKGYADSRETAAAETGLAIKTFSRQPAFSRASAEEDGFLPPAATAIERG
jgi:hypothetical protein